MLFISNTSVGNVRLRWWEDQGRASLQRGVARHFANKAVGTSFVTEVNDMRIWRDAGATLFTIVGLTLALSVTQGWNWPLLADARAGIIALAVVGYGACMMSNSAATRFSVTDPFVMVAIAAGCVLLAAAIIGLFVNTLPYLVAMMGATVVLWVVATTRHLVEGGSETRPVPTA